VDTGLHAKKWTRQQSIDYAIEASEVERYVVYPGQACSYMIGELKIVELRGKAKKALGDRFSLARLSQHGAHHGHRSDRRAHAHGRPLRKFGGQKRLGYQTG
jgi:uncharacterized protein (DUF885 family)